MRWVKISDLHGEALPSLIRKVLAHALGNARSTKRNNEEER
jgi:hypothetical protein